MTDLHISEDAWGAYTEAGDRRDHALEVAAPLIVAAELDRLAEQLKNEWDPHTIWIALHRRARELDRGAS